MNRTLIGLLQWATLAILSLSVSALNAQVKEDIEDFSKLAPEDYSDEQVVQKVMTGGVPMGRWKATA